MNWCYANSLSLSLCQSRTRKEAEMPGPLTSSHLVVRFPPPCATQKETGRQGGDGERGSIFFSLWAQDGGPELRKTKANRFFFLPPPHLPLKKSSFFPKKSFFLLLLGRFPLPFLPLSPCTDLNRLMLPACQILEEKNWNGPSKPIANSEDQIGDYSKSAQATNSPN